MAIYLRRGACCVRALGMEDLWGNEGAGGGLRIVKLEIT